MATLTVYEVDFDPLLVTTITFVDEYVVDVIDDDIDLEGSDGNSTQQLDVSGIPNFSGDSTNFHVFETYTADLNGSPVSFVLLQFDGTPGPGQGPYYVILTSGSVNVGDTVTGTTQDSGSAPPIEYEDLPEFVCFTAGSLIETSAGPRAIETLKSGDLVRVAGEGTKAVRWIGRRTISRIELKQNPHLQPVCIKKDAFGAGTPSADVRVSPQHRIPVSSAALELHFGEQTMLVPAKALVDGDRIVQDEEVRHVEYIHILFDQHELVNVEGLWSESFFPAGCTLDAMAQATLNELYDLFPLLDGDSPAYGDTVLPVLKPFEAQMVQPPLSAPLHM